MMQDICSTVMKSYIVTLGSPILDMIAETENDFITKYDLNSEKISFEKAQNLSILKDFRNAQNIKYITGGSGFNSIRTTNVYIKLT